MMICFFLVSRSLVTVAFRIRLWNTIKIRSHDETWCKNYAAWRWMSGHAVPSDVVPILGFQWSQCCKYCLRSTSAKGPKKISNTHCSELLCNSFQVLFKEWYTQSKICWRFNPPKINMSPEKGPILEDSFIFKPSFLDRDMLFRVGVFFKTCPEQGSLLK